MRFRGHSASVLVVSASLFVAACSAKNEVVGQKVEEEPDATFGPKPRLDPKQCASGHYEGMFNSYANGSGGASGGGAGGGGATGVLYVPVSGTFAFDLKGLQANELRQTLEDNAKLSGSATTFTFDAMIAGSADCNAGTFNSQLNGTLSFPGPGQASIIPFYGTVEGFYDPPPPPPDGGKKNPSFVPTFSGSWKAFQSSSNVQLSAGTWFAAWVSL
jgi:hypothetical protein